MHELSLAQALVARAESVCRAEAALAVRKIHLQIGELAGVEARQLVAAFAIAREGTLCASADLAIRHVAVAWACSRCNEALMQGVALRCPTCGAPATLRAGDALMIETIDLEVHDV